MASPSSLANLQLIFSEVDTTAVATATIGCNQERLGK
jgi:hypothetical protein